MPSHDAARPFVVLGAGPAGLAAAFKLAQRGWRDVTVFERADRVGGNAGSFVIDGIPVDFGSHRLHPVCPPAILADLRALLGDDLLDRPRHGRIRLRGRWVHFPLRPFDLLTRLPPAFMAGALADVVRKRLVSPPREPSFASILEHGLGRTICRDFYFRELAREHRFDGALVLIRGPRGPDYASAAVENPVDLTSHSTIYVRDLNPETRAAVLRAFPNRPVWIVEGPTVTKSRYRVVDGPIPPTAAFHLP